MNTEPTSLNTDGLLRSPLVGRILPDVRGNHHLQTFQGTFEIPLATLQEAATLFNAQGEEDFEICGILARGMLVDGHIERLEYLHRGRVVPSRQ